MIEKYQYFERTKDEQNITVIVTREEILSQFYDKWNKRMIEVNKNAEISEKNCIEDFCAIHWATLIES